MDKKRETMYKTHVDGNLIFNSNAKVFQWRRDITFKK